MKESISSPLLPECEAIWQRTLALTDFDSATLERERVRSAHPAYGLTLVADYPLPSNLLTEIERLRGVCRLVLGNAVELFPDERLHLTVYSLMRSRVNPLSEEELAGIWSCWLLQLEKIAGQASALAVPLRGLAVTRNGGVLVCGATTDGLRWLQDQVSGLPCVAAPRNVPPHVTIGQLKRPCGKMETFKEAMSALYQHSADAVGTLHAARLRMLYYGSRLLGQLIRAAVITLDRAG